MLPLSALSRRALVAAATALAVTTPSAQAIRNPLAFAVVTITGVGHWTPGVFSWEFDAASQRETGIDARSFTGEAHVAAGAGSDRIRAAIVAEVRRQASGLYTGVPANRIAVTLL